MLVSPLVRQQTHQTEVVKAARALDSRARFLVYSWDNLSNKGRIHAPPDRIFAWNELQRREAEELHGIDPDRVVVTGAPHWDRFFALSRRSTVRSSAPAMGSTRTSRSSSTSARRTKSARTSRSSSIAGSTPSAGRPAALRRANVLVRPHPTEVECLAGLGAAPGAGRGHGLDEAEAASRSTTSSTTPPRRSG